MGSETGKSRLLNNGAYVLIDEGAIVKIEDLFRIKDGRIVPRETILQPANERLPLTEVREMYLERMLINGCDPLKERPDYIEEYWQLLKDIIRRSWERDGKTEIDVDPKEIVLIPRILMHSGASSLASKIIGIY